MNRWILACTIAQFPPSLPPPAFFLQTALLVFNAPAIPVRYFMVVCLSPDCLARSISFLNAGTRTGSVRLFGDTRARGLVEVFYNGRWGPVCSRLWGSTEAGVASAEFLNTLYIP